MTSWHDYATLAGQLESHRKAQATRAAGQVSARAALGAELTAIEGLLAAQRDRLSTLYDKLDLSPPILTVQPPEVSDLHEALRRARDTAERSANQLTSVETAATRAPYLAHWSTNLRNALVYGCASAGAFLLNVLVFLATSGASRYVVPLMFMLLPFVAYGIGRSTIGLLFTPVLGNPPPKTRPLGLAICLAPILPLCALWSVAMTLDG